MNHRQALFLLLGFIICLPAIAVTANDLPTYFEARFELFKSGLPIAETHYHFKKQNNSAHFTANTHLTGFAALFSQQRITEKSQLQLSAQKINIHQYSYQQSGDDSTTINSLFDHKVQRIETQINQEDKVYTAFSGEVWDNLSLLLALIVKAKAPIMNLELTAVDKGLLKRYQLSQRGQREIEIDEDIWVKSSVWSRRQGNKEVIFYLNPNSHNFPIKIEEYRDNKLRASLLLKDLKWQP